MPCAKIIMKIIKFTYSFGIALLHFLNHFFGNNLKLTLSVYANGWSGAFSEDHASLFFLRDLLLCVTFANTMLLNNFVTNWRFFLMLYFPPFLSVCLLFGGCFLLLIKSKWFMTERNKSQLQTFTFWTRSVTFPRLST